MYSIVFKYKRCVIIKTIIKRRALKEKHILDKAKKILMGIEKCGLEIAYLHNYIFLKA